MSILAAYARDDALETKVIAFVARLRVPIDRFRCFDCHKIEFASYMVTTEVWREAILEHIRVRRLIGEVAVRAGKGALLVRANSRVPAERIRGHCLLCLPCLEFRLNRPLCIDDFTDVPVNETLRFGHAMGRRRRK